MLIAKLLTAEPTNLRDLMPHLPAKLVAATHRALEKEPERRFDSADQFLAAMPSLERSPSSVELAGTVGVGSLSGSLQVATPAFDSVRRTAGPQPAKSRAWLWIVGAVALAGGGLGTYLALRTPPAASAPVSDKPTGSAAGPSLPQQTPPSPPPPANTGSAAAVVASPPPAGRVSIKSTPTGAKVYIDHATAPIAPTPAEIALAPGPHHIRVELPGYAPVDEDETVESGNKDTIMFPLQRLVGGGAGVRQPPVQTQHTVQKLAPTPPGPPPSPYGTGNVTTPGPSTGPATTPPGDNGHPASKPNPYDAKPNPYN